MSTRVVERVDDWDGSPFTGGYGELQEMASREFSGVVRANGAELCMTNGSVVGIRRGSIEDFEATEGTSYTAPAPALPMLAVMQERSDEVRAQYYSEETSISEVNETLEDGGFSGYIELSENVLSGDYYIVYHGGQSMSVAFVGSSGRLIDGDEAFEQANGEVGIYEVRPVDVDTIEIPQPDDATATVGTADSDAGADSDDGTESETESADDAGAADDTENAAAESGDGTGEDDPGDGTGADAGDADDGGRTGAAETAPPAEASATGEQAPEETTADEATPEGETAGGQNAGDARAAADAGGTRPREGGGGQPSGTETRQPRGGADGTTEPRTEEPRRAGGADTRDQQPARERAGGSRQTSERSGTTGRQQPAQRGAATGEDGRQFETRAIPSLDPERSQTVDPAPVEEGARADAPGQDPRSVDPQPREGRSPSGADRRDSRADPAANPAAGTEPTDGEAEAPTPRVDDLRAELADREDEIDRLEDELSAATEENERLQAELEEVRAERDDLAAEVERLETELEQLEAELGAAADSETRLTPAEALDGTDIFVRYESKGATTLEKAHDSGARPTDIADNLHLEKHTQFDAASVSVAGQAYPEFLEGTVEFQFVRWVIMELLFEIRDTGHDDSLRTLYDALPNIDRAELHGEIEVVYTEDGQETRTTETFDVVMRDRMGTPLVVANLNDSREAATRSMMEDLIAAAERVGRATDDFAAAFLVTESFFEPGALETAGEATQGGLLSRNKYESFVNLSRKRGYHLCLVEARNENFHLAVPEL